LYFPRHPALVGDRRVQKRYQGVSCFRCWKRHLHRSCSLLSNKACRGDPSMVRPPNNHCVARPQKHPINIGDKIHFAHDTGKAIERICSMHVRRSKIRPHRRSWPAHLADQRAYLQRHSRPPPQGRDFQRQYDLNPARCQRTMVSGFTIANASQTLGNNRQRPTNTNRSKTLKACFFGAVAAERLFAAVASKFLPQAPPADRIRSTTVQPMSLQKPLITQ
jgi:hypothetical protein